MSDNFNFDHWRERLHVCDDFGDEAKSDEFWGLLDEAEKNMGYDVAVELLKTFSDVDDFGVQERTRNVLEASGREIFYPALVRELHGIIERSPKKQWAVTLIGIEVDYGDFNLLISYVNKASEDVRREIILFLKSDDVLSEYPDVSRYLTDA
ncbi:hypothetical protein [Burkholderia sp. 22PA0106]|uniref:hypothetical protein n=1 Tax=Burkholderia sp. 22PA0106 TaxID=3237371 RepID=UPI0039C11DEF